MVEYNRETSEKYAKLDHIMKELVFYPTILNIVGNVKGLDILEIGVGSGLFARKLKELGAGKVLGFDISEEQIRIAKNIEKEKQQGIEYLVQNHEDTEKLGQFDIATAIFSMHYSSTQEGILKTAKGAYQNLKNRGRFIAVNNTPKGPYFNRKIYRVLRKVELPIRNGSKAQIIIDDGNVEVSFANWLWDRETYEHALKQAGFKKVTWHDAKVSEEGIARFGADFWEDFKKMSEHYAIFEAIK